jgi:hypothetical protein
MTEMLIEELIHVQGSREKKEAEEIRRFLARYRDARPSDGSPGLELTVRKASKMGVLVVYAHITGFGVAKWFPALVIPSSDRIERVMVECGVLERYPIKLMPKRDAWGEVEPRRPPVIEKVAIQMVGG